MFCLIMHMFLILTKESFEDLVTVAGQTLYSNSCCLTKLSSMKTQRRPLLVANRSEINLQHLVGSRLSPNQVVFRLHFHLKSQDLLVLDNYLATSLYPEACWGFLAAVSSQVVCVCVWVEAGGRRRSAQWIDWKHLLIGQKGRSIHIHQMWQILL